MTEIGTKGRSVPSPIEGLCEEASMYSTITYIPCGASADNAVYHKRDNCTYRMCDPCANHNTRNRGGELIVQKGKILI